MKRQRGRNRGNKPQQHNANRAFDSNGPEGIKVRGNAQHVYDKYQQLARDATGAGDRVLAENYLQHAEHYFRLIRALQPHRAVTDIIGRDAYSSGLDIDFEDESNRGQPPPEGSQGEGGQDQNDGGETRQDGGGRRDYGDRDNRENRDTRENRDNNDRDRDRNRRPRRDRDGDERRPREERDERPNRDEPRQRTEREDRGGKDPLAVVEPRGEEKPPRPQNDDGPRLRSSEGDESHAPAFLKTPGRTKPAGEGDLPKPRRARRPKSEETPADAE